MKGNQIVNFFIHKTPTILDQQNVLMSSFIFIIIDYWTWDSPFFLFNMQRKLKVTKCKALILKFIIINYAFTKGLQ